MSYLVRSIWLLVGLAASGVSMGQAQYTVTSPADSGSGSLREAMALAESDGVPSVIRFGGPLTIRIRSQLPNSNADDTTIDAEQNVILIEPETAGAQFLAVRVRGDRFVMRGVRFAGFARRAISVELGAGQTSFESLEISGGDQAINVNVARGLAIRDTRFRSQTGVSLFVLDVNGANVGPGNVFEMPGANALLLTGSQSRGVIVEGNDFRDSGAAAVNVSASGTRVAGNRFDRCWPNAIRVSAGNCTVESNMITSSQDGIVVASAPNTEPPNVIGPDNRIERCQRYGVRVDRSSGTVLARNDAITQCWQTGVFLFESTDCLIEENRDISGNYVHGIEVGRNCDRVQILGGNVVHGNAQAGVIVSDSGDHRIAGGTFSGNGADGVDFRGAIDSTVEDCLIEGNGVSGVHYDRFPTGNVVQRNRIVGNFQGYVEIIGGGNEVRDNWVEGNLGDGIVCGFNDTLVVGNIIVDNLLVGVRTNLPTSLAVVDGNTAFRNGIGFEGDGEFVNNIAWGSTGPFDAYFASTAIVEGCCFHDANLSYPPSAGNISSDPDFVATGSVFDPHLRPSSPCRNAGRARTRVRPHDFEGDPRVHELVTDIGADEFHPRLYLQESIRPGGILAIRVIANPGDQVFLLASLDRLATPVPTPFGLLHLGGAPFLVLSGVASLDPVAIDIPLPTSLSGDLRIYSQPLIQNQLENLLEILL